jgi:hypothetical protein
MILLASHLGYSGPAQRRWRPPRLRAASSRASCESPIQRENGVRYDSFAANLEVRDTEIAAHCEFRKHLYDHDVVPEARAAALDLV